MLNIPLFSSDATERALFLKFFLRLSFPGILLLFVGETMALQRGMIGSGVFALMLLLDLPVLLLFSGLVYDLIDQTATGFTHTVLGAGNLKPEPAHSGCESLVARGLYREAVAAYQALITQHPMDNLARIKLAEIHRAHLAEPAEAERLYGEVRRNNPDPRHAFLASNLLIELYRSTGRKDRLMVELARFADAYRDTRAGRDAARLLGEMKAEMRGS
jgi:tetratricopeptide (TPR) repeat protein